MTIGRVSVAFVTALVAACGATHNGPIAADSADAAGDLARSSIIVDGHIDVPYRLNEEWVDVSFSTEDGDFDYPRAVSGGLNARSCPYTYLRSTTWRKQERLQTG